LLARRNLRLGRGDRRGALRTASFIFVLSAAAWLLQAHHVWSFSEIYLFFNFLGSGLVVSGLTWMVYIALEPFARRLWPRGLISWNRLLSGRLRDPLVGRDILIGAAFGVFNSCWWGLHRLIAASLSLPPERPPRADLASLSGIGPTIGQYFDHIVFAVYMPVAWLFAVLLLRFLLRRQWIAVLVLTAWAIGTWIPGQPSPLLFIPFAIVAFAGFLFVLLRFGVLSGIFWGLYMWPSSYVIFTLDASAWYAGTSLFTMLLLAAIAGYAFWISLAGRPLVRADVLEG
jgi:serine/threonine-protein kinase